MVKLFGKLGVAAGGATALLLVGAMAAMACTSLATLTPNPPSGDPGASVAITGQAFDPGSSVVSLHWNTAQGPVLATTTPDAGGNITATVTIPKDATAGYYVIIATQTDKDGQPVFGTPARTSIQVGQPSGATAHGNNVAAPAANVAAAAAPASATSQTSGGWIAALAIFGILGVGLFVAGLAFFVREVRRSEAVALAR